MAFSRKIVLAMLAALALVVAQTEYYRLASQQTSADYHNFDAASMEAEFAAAGIYNCDVQLEGDLVDVTCVCPLCPDQVTALNSIIGTYTPAPTLPPSPSAPPTPYPSANPTPSPTTFE